MDTIRIPNAATYTPLPLTDIAIAGPIASRILLGATLPGRALQGVALLLYAASSFNDWVERLGVRSIDFLAEFDADVHNLTDMPDDARREEMGVLVERLNDGYTAERPTLSELAPVVDEHLTNYIASITDQRVLTSLEIRRYSVAQLIFPFALGAADPLSGDVAIFRDSGVFQPHVVAHEFSHRKGYLRELDAQALAYLSLSSSGEPALVQAALCERLHRNLRVAVGDDAEAFDQTVNELGLRSELEPQMLALRPDIPTLAQPIFETMRTIYDIRMKLTGQNGISDYDLGFTNFLYTYETSTNAQQVPGVGAIHGRSNGGE